MRSITLILVAATTAVSGALFPLQGQQGGGGAALDAYIRAVADHFDVPPSEVETLAEWGLPTEHLPVALFVARRGGVSPDALLALRRSGRSWQELAGRYGLDASTFHTELPSGAVSGELSRVQRAYAERPRGEWGNIVLDEEEIVHLVNLAFLTDFLGESPGGVLAAVGRAGGWVPAYVELVRTRG